MKYSRIISVGSYLPKNKVTNDQLPEALKTSHEWIHPRTGINQRFIAAEGELTSDLAVNAAKIALEKAGLKEVDLIIVATTTPDNTFPATAVAVQHKLGMRSGFAFDVQAVCSGFIFALATADNFIKQGQAKTALVIGAETLSRILDWTDRGTCVLFGDGAGAVVLQESETPGILSSHLHTDGEYQDLLYVDGGVSQKTVGVLKMSGKEVFKHAVDKMGDCIDEGLKANKLKLEDVKWVVPHQANLRIMEKIADKYNIPMEKVLTTVTKHANTSAASIPLALAVHEKDFKKGDFMVLTSLGGGFAWGSVVLKW